MSSIKFKSFTVSLLHLALNITILFGHVLASDAYLCVLIVRRHSLNKKTLLFIQISFEMRKKLIVLCIHIQMVQICERLVYILKAFLIQFNLNGLHKNLCNLILIANVLFFQCSTQCPNSLFFVSFFFPIFFLFVKLFKFDLSDLIYLFLKCIWRYLISFFKQQIECEISISKWNSLRKNVFFLIFRFNLSLAIRPIIISKLTCCLETDRVKQNEFLLEFKFLALLLDIHTCIATLPSCSITKSTLFSTEELNTRTLA